MVINARIERTMKFAEVVLRFWLDAAYRLLTHPIQAAPMPAGKREDKSESLSITLCPADDWQSNDIECRLGPLTVRVETGSERSIS